MCGQERNAYLNEISDLKKVEEYPDESDNEGGDNNKEEPVIVPETKKGPSSAPNTKGWGSTCHAHYTKGLEKQNSRKV